jgi:hypothetical protein
MIRLATLLQYLFAVIAVSGYIANGAQTHLMQKAGETLSLPMCSGSAPRIIQIGGDAAPVETPNTCCGDCVLALALPTNNPHLLAPSSYYAVQAARPPHTSIHPRSPLWPGAPPQGPPAAHTA